MAKPTLTIVQGESQAIVISGIVDSSGAPLDVTGWSVDAQLREYNEGPIVAEWVSGTPTGDQGQATASVDGVRLELTYAMSSAWGALARGVWQCEATEPGPNGRRARIGDTLINIDREVVR